MKYLLAVLAIVLGVAGVVFGEADDSPGLQLVGGALVIGGALYAVWIARRR